MSAVKDSIGNKPASTFKPNFVKNEVLVKLAKNLTTETRTQIKQSALVQKSEKVVSANRNSDIYLFKLKPGQTVAAAIKKLKARHDVLVAEPNYISHIMFTPNAAAFTNQWG